VLVAVADTVGLVLGVLVGATAVSVAVGVLLGNAVAILVGLSLGGAVSVAVAVEGTLVGADRRPCAKLVLGEAGGAGGL
jgi:hypothetical protein